MSFAQLTQRDSLRDIENCLNAVSGKLYHCGIKHAVPRNTLAKANELRDWRIYADFARVLIEQTLYSFSQICGITPFKKVPLNALLSKSSTMIPIDDAPNLFSNINI